MNRKTARLIVQAALLIVAALLAFIEIPRGATGELTLRALDVGQGDAILFQFPTGETMMIDAGPRKSSSALMNKLRRAGIRSIDIFVATHPHEDHIGGSLAVLNGLDVGKVWDSGYVHGSKIQKDMLLAIKNKGIRYGRPKAGFEERIGDVAISVLAPGDDPAWQDLDANNSSIIIRVVYRNVSFLMMGDAEHKERRLIGHFPRTTIIKMAHHGSRNGFDETFLDRTAPRAAIISCAEGNSYGHPHKETVGALDKRGIKRYATVDGDVIVTTDGENCEITQEK